MAANMTVVTHLLNRRRVGRFANRKTLNNDEASATLKYELEGTLVVTMKSHGGVPESEEPTVAVDAETYDPGL